MTGNTLNNLKVGEYPLNSSEFSDMHKLNLVFDYLFSRTGSAIEAILELCEDYGFNYDDIGHIISEDKMLRDYINSDCREYKYLRS